MSRIIAIANHKGGVGKTTTTASLGAALSLMGKKVLLVDLDAQANLTTSFVKEEPENTVYEALNGKCSLPIVSVKENIDLVCSSLEMAGIELELSSRMSREFILKNLLEGVSEYDYVLLDCPPSLGLVTINAMAAADELFIPLTAEALPSKGLAMLMNILGMVQQHLNHALRLSGIIITRWENSNLSRMVEESLREEFGEAVFKTKVRKNISLAEAPLYSSDIISYSPGSNGAKDYISLAEEVVNGK